MSRNVRKVAAYGKWPRTLIRYVHRAFKTLIAREGRNYNFFGYFVRMERDLYYLTPEKALEHARNGNLSTADAADRCDVKVRTFRRWLKLGLRDRPRRGVNTALSFKIEAQIARTIEFYFFQGYSLSRARLKLSLAASTTRP